MDLKEIGIITRNQEDNIRMHLKEMGIIMRNWADLAQDRNGC